MSELSKGDVVSLGVSTEGTGKVQETSQRCGRSIVVNDKQKGGCFSLRNWSAIRTVDGRCLM